MDGMDDGSYEHIAHGVARRDPYHWMRLSEAQRNAIEPDAHTRRVLSHLRAENAHTERVLDHLTGLRKQLYREMRSRIKEDDQSVPYRENGYWYSYRFEEGKEYPIHERKRDTPGSAIEVLLNENILAEGLEHFDLGSYEVSPCNGLLAYSVDTLGRRLYELRVRDLNTGDDLGLSISETSGACAWGDPGTLFYVKKDETLRDARIYRHVLGRAPEEDELVFEERDPAFSCDIQRSRSEAYLIVRSTSTLSTESWVLPVSEPRGEFRLFAARRPGHEYEIFHRPAVHGQRAKWYVLTNWEAKDFRLMECPEERTGREEWTERIPHRPGVLLEDVDSFKDHLVLSERRDGLTHLRIIDERTGAEHEIYFEDTAYVTYTGTNPEWASSLLRYGYTSLTRPHRVMQHDMEARTDLVLKEQEVLGGFRSEDHVCERIWAVAKDGVRVPISLVRRRDTPVNGTAPLLLYGYGAYGHSMEPAFSTARLSLLDRGFTFALAHVRGGEELGRDWYDQGRTVNKMNSFTDLIACAEHLLAGGHGDPARLCCMGGSAGGLLVGAVLNMRPELWRAAVAEVPFVDVVTTMLDQSLPLTTGEFDEWGDPRTKEDHDRMLEYSPYDNVRDAAYPALLVTTALHDSQVQFWEPAKWVARLRDHQQGPAPILLWTDLDAGHGGASGRFERLKEVALNYAFLIWQCGLEPDPKP
ncbi:MAG: S9 family peptidase [Flavobacteriales bacterium]|nr:S9 family peptidase [Flavobacteriales bacterium]